ncbi:MAG: hypothetical protein JXR68_13070 [Bacteroidales bacterium]|nr:hypothetical protein [Bacteroidales bacterium]
MKDIIKQEQELIKEMNQEVETFETPEVRQIDEFLETERNPFLETEKKEISENANEAAERLLKSFNETVSNLISAIMGDSDPSKFLPPKEQEKQLAKDIATVIPNLKINKGTGLVMSIFACYIPVTTAIIIESKIKKNAEKKLQLATNELNV